MIMIHYLLILCILLVIKLNNVKARPGYVAKLPNSGNVAGIQALGHISSTGGGARNQFGIDFAAFNYTWNATFCAKDSDADGLTNGQELGDPCCKWTVGMDSILINASLSHPGNASSKTTNPSLLTYKCTNTTTPAPTPTPAPSSASTTIPSSILCLSLLLFYFIL